VDFPVTMFEGRFYLQVFRFRPSEATTFRSRPAEAAATPFLRF
jgi:hypothetical protein